MRIFCSIIILWCLYIVKVGGDFMEFRLLVPILPLLFVLVTALILCLGNLKVEIALVLMLLIGSYYHAVSFHGKDGLESISGLNYHVDGKTENWAKVGLTLREVFSDRSQPVLIATTACGAIPYYSQLPTVDILGLNDKWISKNGIVIGTRPGHRVSANLEYLAARGVNLVIGHPQIERSSITPKSYYAIRDLGRFWLVDIKADLIPHTAKVLEIPLDSEFRITVLYLTPNDQIDKVIRERSLVTYNISRS